MSERDDTMRERDDTMSERDDTMSERDDTMSERDDTNNLHNWPRLARARGPCKIVAPGREELFIDWRTIICNIGQPATASWTDLRENYHRSSIMIISAEDHELLFSIVLRGFAPLSPVRCETDDEWSLCRVVTLLKIFEVNIYTGAWEATHLWEYFILY